MRISVVLALAILPLSPLVAQQPAAKPAPAGKPTPEPPKPKVVATPTPKPKSVLGRLFSPKATPTPAPVATPTPVAKPKPRPKRVKPTEAEPAEPATEKPATTPEPAKPEKAPETKPEEPKPETAPVVKPGKGKKPAPVKPEKPDYSGLDDAAKYKIVKAKALEDAQVKELKAKADAAVSEEDSQRATQAFNRALFRKVRDIEPSLDGYVDRIEEAMAKRLSAEKKD